MFFIHEVHSVVLDLCATDTSSRAQVAKSSRFQQCFKEEKSIWLPKSKGRYKLIRGFPDNQ